MDRNAYTGRQVAAGLDVFLLGLAPAKALWSDLASANIRPCIRHKGQACLCADVLTAERHIKAKAHLLPVGSQRQALILDLES